jgi:nucleoside-diphosphate-sugar epimerase
MPGAAAPLLAERPEVILPSRRHRLRRGGSRFDKGYRINLDGTRYLIEAIRQPSGGYKPRLVFTSSIAVFGAPFPERSATSFFTRR